MEKSDQRKRPRQQQDDETTSSASPPPYGTKEYWEDRYKRIQTKSIKEGEEEPDPFHAWYFNYEELAPLILPLILGDADELESGENHDLPSTGKVPEEENNNNNNKNSASTVLDANEPSKSAEKAVDVLTEGDVSEQQGGASTSEDENDGNSSRGEDSDNDDDEIVEMADEDEGSEGDDGPPVRSGLAKDGPIEILEVGCGDVPLGKDIIVGIQELEKSDGTIVTEKILKRVICVDYSTIVINAMTSKDQSDSSATGSVPLEYECADARKLPHESERFNFVLEKGTMDAMLSDVSTGSDNCRAIVAEMARVVAVSGIIMVISHVNAHTQNGMDWLNNIVVPGLRKGAGRHQWSVEVHGGDVPEDQNEDESPGPAVYIIHKGPIDKKTSTTVDSDPPSISLRFFSY